MPNSPAPGTSSHTIRGVPDLVWQRAKTRAAREGTTLGSVVRDALALYAQDEPNPPLDLEPDQEKTP